MRFGLMAILGCAMALAGPAQAVRSEQTTVRAQAGPARVQAVRPASPQAARPASSAAARPASYSTARPASSSAASRASTSRAVATRPGPARASDTRSSRATAQPRHAVPYRNATYSAPQLRDRSGRLVVNQPGYQRAVLRGQGARFAAACTTHRGRRVCGGTRQVAMRWSGGLAPAAGNQSSCPDGTMATLAVGHENVVRCVPL